VQSVLRRGASVHDHQHPQLHGDIEDDRSQTRQARERHLGNIDKRQGGEPQQRRKHPKIGVGFAVVGKRLEIDRFAVDGDLAVQQVNEHVVETAAAAISAAKCQSDDIQPARCGAPSPTLVHRPGSDIKEGPKRLGDANTGFRREGSSNR
jgi:hypothetical protein